MPRTLVKTKVTSGDDKIDIDYLMEREKKGWKAVDVLTDGVSEPADFEGIAQNMVQSKMTCSTVAVGDDCDF